MEPHRTPHDVHERLLELIDALPEDAQEALLRLLPRDTVGHIQGAVLAHTASVPTGLLEP